jgi:mannose-6-phosphate isomerase-like protein (cupin superfamily)
MNALVKSPIEALQAAMSELPQVSLPTNHYWADGMYCRELFRPKDTTIVGKVHKREHFYIIVSGEVTVVSGDRRERIKAPRVLVSSPGTKRAVYAHEDSVCLTVHRTPFTDMNDIERDLVEEDATAMFGPGNTLKLLETS